MDPLTALHRRCLLLLPLLVCCHWLAPAQLFKEGLLLLRELLIGAPAGLLLLTVATLVLLHLDRLMSGHRLREAGRAHIERVGGLDEHGLARVALAHLGPRAHAFPNRRQRAYLALGLMLVVGGGGVGELVGGTDHLVRIAIFFTVRVVHELVRRLLGLLGHDMAEHGAHCLGRSRTGFPRRLNFLELPLVVDVLVGCVGLGELDGHLLAVGVVVDLIIV